MHGRNGRMMLAAVGMTMALALTTSRAVAEEKEGKGEENEVKVKLAEAPAAVRATLEREAFGATLPDQIDKETDGGKVIYEADVKIGGKNYEIKAAEDGTLVSKKLDQEDEKDEKGEKEKKDKD